ncbi:hypothetical protein EJB05_21325, partial [Eragrostis curvula]
MPCDICKFVSCSGEDQRSSKVVHISKDSWDSSRAMLKIATGMYLLHLLVILILVIVFLILLIMFFVVRIHFKKYLCRIRNEDPREKLPAILGYVDIFWSLGTWQCEPRIDTI